jgi:hypothetical protein
MILFTISKGVLSFGPIFAQNHDGQEAKKEVINRQRMLER